MALFLTFLAAKLTGDGPKKPFYAAKKGFYAAEKALFEANKAFYEKNKPFLAAFSICFVSFLTFLVSMSTVVVTAKGFAAVSLTWFMTRKVFFVAVLTAILHL